MRTIIVSYRKEWETDNVKAIPIPEDDLAVLLLGLTRSEHVITNIEIKGVKDDAYKKEVAWQIDADSVHRIGL